MISLLLAAIFFGSHLLLALVLYVVFLGAHSWLFGVSPFGA